MEVPQGDNDTGVEEQTPGRIRRAWNAVTPLYNRPTTSQLKKFGKITAGILAIGGAGLVGNYIGTHKQDAKLEQVSDDLSQLQSRFRADSLAHANDLRILRNQYSADSLAQADSIRTLNNIIDTSLAQSKNSPVANPPSALASVAVVPPPQSTAPTAQPSTPTITISGLQQYNILQPSSIAAPDTSLSLTQLEALNTAVLDKRLYVQDALTRNEAVRTDSAVLRRGMEGYVRNLNKQLFPRENISYSIIRELTCVGSAANGRECQEPFYKANPSATYPDGNYLVSVTDSTGKERNPNRYTQSATVSAVHNDYQRRLEESDSTLSAYQNQLDALIRRRGITTDLDKIVQAHQEVIDSQSQERRTYILPNQASLTDTTQVFTEATGNILDNYNITTTPAQRDSYTTTIQHANPQLAPTDSLEFKAGKAGTYDLTKANNQLQEQFKVLADSAFKAYAVIKEHGLVN